MAGSQSANSRRANQDKDVRPAGVALLVAILIGQLQFPFADLRYKAYRSALDQDSNIKVVATDQGRWVR